MAAALVAAQRAADGLGVPGSGRGTRHAAWAVFQILHDDDPPLGGFWGDHLNAWFCFHRQKMMTGASIRRRLLA